MLIVQILNDEPPSPRKLNSRVPRDLETICLKCLQKEPKRRYGTAHELALDLQRHLLGEAISARPVGRLERGWRWCRRNRTVAGLASAAVVSLVLGAGFSTVFAIKAVTQTGLALDRLNDANRARGELAKQAEQLRSRVYAGQILLANLSIINGDTETARQTLSETDPLLRGWEYDRLNWVMDTSLKTLSQGEPPPPLYSFDISPDQSRVVVGRDSGLLEVWDLRSGQQIIAVEAHGAPRGVLDVVFTRDSKRIISAGCEGTVKVWNATDLTLITTLFDFSDVTGDNVDTEIWGLDVSPDDQYLAWSDRRGMIHIWTLTDGHEIRTWQAHDKCVWSVQFSPDAKSIVSASQDGTAKIWKVAEDTEPVVLRGHTSEVDCAMYSPDGSQIATCSDDKTLRFWNATTGELEGTIQAHSDWVRRLSFCHTRPWLATVSRDGTARVWDLEKGTCRMVFRGHTAYVRDVEFWSDGEALANVNETPSVKLVSGGDDGRLKVWDVTQHPEAARLPTFPDWPLGMAVSPNGEFIVVTCSERRLMVFDTASGVISGQIDLASSAVCVVFLPNGDQFAIGDDEGGVTVWNVHNGKLDFELVPLLPPDERIGDKVVTAMAVRPDGKRLVLCHS
jgi:WD40 repeat protein